MGNVIINIEPKLTYQQLFKLLRPNSSDGNVLTDLLEKPIWHQHEVAAIDDDELKEYLWNNFAQSVDNEAAKMNFEKNFEAAWNALLLDIPVKRIETLLRLKSKYRLFLLSNTNQTHINYVNAKLEKEMQMPTLEQLFEKCYYSHILKLRKPSHEIYKFVLQDQNLVASETLFLDDRADNILASQEVGIQSIIVKPETDISLILQDF